MKEKNYSEETARRIDAEVKQIVEDCHKKALVILKKNRKYLNIMAEALLERETLDGGEVDDILAGRKIAEKPSAVKPENPESPSTPAPAETSPKVVLKPQTAPSQAIQPGGHVG